MQFEVLTLFPAMFQPVLGASILGRAQEAGLVRVVVHDLRDFTDDKHRTADDYPYGGGPGMVLKVEPIARALDLLCRDEPIDRAILLTPQGNRLDSRLAAGLAKLNRIVLVCGRYEGVDERIRMICVDQEVSIGDYVLTGGELPAMVLMDVVARLVPGVVGDARATAGDSFSSGLLEYPQFTRPREFRGVPVPDVLLSGDHAKVALWRLDEAVRRTLERRPDLLEQGDLPEEVLEALLRVAPSLRRAEVGRNGERGGGPGQSGQGGA